MRPFLRILRRFIGHLTLATVGSFVIPFIFILAYLRFFGLPDNIKQLLLAEVEGRHMLPYPIDVERLLLDPTGAILAEKVVMFRDASRTRVILRVDRVRISIAWFSWWRGHGLIDGASVANAEVSLPVGDQQTADFHEVNADFYRDGNDIKIENAEAKLLCFSLFIRGTIHNDGMPKSQPSTAEQKANRDKIWGSVLNAVQELATESPLEVQLDFETSSSDIVGGRANFDLEAHRMTWRTVMINELALHATLADNVVTLDECRLGGERGEFSAFGAWKLPERKAQIQFSSSFDFTSLAPAFTGPTRAWLDRLDFPLEAPAIAGRVNVDLSQGFQADLQTDIDWRNFTFNGVTFQRLTIPLACDSKRILIPGMTIESDAGNVDAKLFFDFTPSPPNLRAEFTSTLDPTVMKGVLGEGFDNFLTSCTFTPGQGPQISAVVNSNATAADAWLLKGKIFAQNFTYKGTSFKSATSDYTYQALKLDLPNLVILRPEGTAQGGVYYNFANKSVRLQKMVTDLDVAGVAPVMGPNFVKYTAPYHFRSPPHVVANGLVDLAGDKVDLDTDLTIDIVGKSGMDWTLFNIPYDFEQVNGQLYFKNRRMNIVMRKCGLDGGILSGDLDINLRESPCPYDLNMKLDQIDFQKFMIQSFQYKESTGRMNVNTKLHGLIGHMETLTGVGDVNINSGNLTEIPFLGALTPHIPALSTANTAKGTYKAENSLIITDDLTISSSTFSLIGHGSYNHVKDDLQMDMRVNMKNFLGILLFPVSKITEYHGSGPLKNVTWVPKNF